MDLQEYVDAQADKLYEDIKGKLGERWEGVREKYEDDIKAVSKYFAEYTFKSQMGMEVDPHLEALRAIALDFTAIATIEAQSVMDAIVEAVKEFAQEFAKVLFKAAASAGIEALKDLN